MDKHVTVGGLLNETVAAISAARGALLLYVLVLGGANAAAVLLALTDPMSASIGLASRIPADGGFGAALFVLGSAVLSIIAGFLLAKTMVATKRRVRMGMAGFGGYFLFSILYGLGVMVGLLLLIIPGILMMVRWSASKGFLLGSGKGASDALSASWQATKGHGMAIFLAAVVMLLAAILISMVPVGILTVVDESLAAITSGFFESAGSALFIALGAAVYFRVDESGSAYVEVFE